jgi:hypothetical protein
MTVREEAVEATILERFAELRLSDEERRYIACEFRKLKGEDTQRAEETAAALKLGLAQIEERTIRLTDAYIDRLIEKDTFEVRKKALLMERIGAEEKLGEVSTGRFRISEELEHFLERAGGACSAYKIAKLDEKRDLVDSLTSNRVLRGKSPEISLAFPLEEVADRFKSSHGGPRRDGPRTWHALLPRLLSLIIQRKPVPIAARLE